MTSPFKIPSTSIEHQVDVVRDDIKQKAGDKQISELMSFHELNIDLPFSLETESYRDNYESLDQVSPQLFWMECSESGKQLISCRLVMDLEYEIEKYEFSNGMSVILNGGVDAIHMMWAMACLSKHEGTNLKMIGAHNPEYSDRGVVGKINTNFAYHLAFSYPDLFDYSTISKYDQLMHIDPDRLEGLRCERPCYCDVGGFCKHVSGMGPSCDIRRNRCNGGCCGA